MRVLVQVPFILSLIFGHNLNFQKPKLQRCEFQSNVHKAGEFTFIVNVTASSVSFTFFPAMDTLNTVLPRRGLAAEKITGESYFTKDNREPSNTK